MNAMFFDIKAFDVIEDENFERTAIFFDDDLLHTAGVPIGKEVVSLAMFKRGHLEVPNIFIIFGYLFNTC